MKKVYLLAITSILIQTTFSQDSSSCNDVTASPPTRVVAYIGWPYKLTCGLITWVIGPDLSQLAGPASPQNVTVQCDISNQRENINFEGETTLDNLGAAGTELPALTDEDDLLISVRIQALSAEHAACISATVQLQPAPFPQISCEDFAREHEGGVATPPNPHNADTSKAFECEIPPSSYLSISGGEEFTYHLEHNCNTELFNEAGPLPNQELTVESFERDDAGFFVCSVSYNEMKEYLSYEPLCLAYNKTWNARLELNCSPEQLEKRINETAEFECGAVLGSGNITEDHFQVHWLLDTGERISCMDGAVTSVEERSYCYYEFSNNGVCSNTSAAAPEDNAELNIKLEIPRVQLDDFGSYTVVLTTRYGLGESYQATLSIKSLQESTPSTQPGLTDAKRTVPSSAAQDTSTSPSAQTGLPEVAQTDQSSSDANILETTSGGITTIPTTALVTMLTIMTSLHSCVF